MNIVVLQWGLQFNINFLYLGYMGVQPSNLSLQQFRRPVIEANSYAMLGLRQLKFSIIKLFFYIVAGHLSDQDHKIQMPARIVIVKGGCMNKLFNHMTVAIIVVSLLIAPVGVVAEESYDETASVSDAAMAADAILVRPMGIVSMVAGFGLFIVSSPFSALGGNIGEAWGTLVAAPAKFTFVRPLGDF